jgi:KAP family P-loop domain
MNMAAQNASPIEQIHAAIQSHNPFDRPRFVKQEDVWGQGFPDVEQINAHASDAVFEAIRRINENQLSTIGLTILAERGLGKSHLISRIRHKLQQNGQALFVYMSEYGNLDKIHQEFLQTLAASLRRNGSQSVMQWQEIATALLNDVFKKDLTPKHIIDIVMPAQISKVVAEGKPASEWISKLRDYVLKEKPEFDDPYLLQALLWTLSKPHAIFAVNWLGGKSLAQVQADALGLPPNSCGDDDVSATLQMSRQILNLIGKYKTLVICFDELDGPGVSEDGFTRAMVVAGLGKDIANGLSKGVLITTMYEETFKNQVRAMPQAEAVVDRIASTKIDLNPPDGDAIVALVSRWLSDFYTAHNLVPPTATYPFEESLLRSWEAEQPIVRKVLQRCAEKFGSVIDHPDPVIPPEEEGFQKIFEQEVQDLAWSVSDYIDEKDILVKALRLGFESLIGIEELVENVKISNIEDISEARGGDRGHINFRIVGKELATVNKKNIRIGVAIAQQQSPLSTLTRLNNYDKFNLTRGCLVRSKPIGNNATAAKTAVMDLLQNKGEWVLLTEEHIKPLLALSFMHDRLEDYEITPEEFFEELEKSRIVIDNPLIREILSKPNGKPPKVADDVAPSVPTVADIDLSNANDLALVLE